MAIRSRSLIVAGPLLGLVLFVAGCETRKTTKTRSPKPKANATKPLPAKPAKTPESASSSEPPTNHTFESEGTSTGFTLWMGDGIQMEFLRVGRGWFMMGGGNSGIPRQKAIIDRSFFLGKYEVTQEQWELVMGANPSLNKKPQNPLNRVSWTDCQQFIERVNDRYQRPGRRFCMPTETQWEYTCRAGEGFSGYSTPYSGFILDEYAWHAGNSGNDVHPVGQKRPNAWGFYDILGNVAEWCDDDPQLSFDNAHPPGHHVVRGGGYHDGDTLCNVEGRQVRRDAVPFRFDGLRLACVDDE